jgi:chemotaxis family two-component system response regulator Rcp1
MNSDGIRLTPVLLHVEDDDSIAYLLRLALHEIRVDIDVFRTCNGEDAIAFLTRNGVFGRAPIPDIVVLDLNLPKKNGHDVLTEIRRQIAFRHLPVIMLTSSSAPEDRERAIALGANEYVLKPKNMAEFFMVANRIAAYIEAASSPAPNSTGAGGRPG